MSNTVKATLLVLGGPVALTVAIWMFGIGAVFGAVVFGSTAALVIWLIYCVERELDASDARRAEHQVPPPPFTEAQTATWRVWPPPSDVTYDLGSLLDSDRFTHKYETTTEVIDDGKPVARDGT